MEWRYGKIRKSKRNGNSKGSGGAAAHMCGILEGKKMGVSITFIFSSRADFLCKFCLYYEEIHCRMSRQSKKNLLDRLCCNFCMAGGCASVCERNG